MKTEPNDPIVPSLSSGSYGYTGLSKREIFAAMAMQGQLAAITTSNNFTYEAIKAISKDSVMLAEGLIKALNEDDFNF